MDGPLVSIFTDGACSGNPGPGGWAYLLRHPASGSQREDSGGEPDTTNNRMELRAVIEGLAALSRPSTIDLTSDIPLGERPPEYMVSLAKEGPTGPVNVVLAQMHLPNGAEIDEVRLDGKSVGYSPFDERGRPSVVLPVTLPPRETQQLTFEFTEPADAGPGQVAIQPLGSGQATEVVEAPCRRG